MNLLKEYTIHKGTIHNIFPAKYTYVGSLCAYCVCFIYKSSSFQKLLFYFLLVLTHLAPHSMVVARYRSRRCPMSGPSLSDMQIW